MTPDRAAVRTRQRRRSRASARALASFPDLELPALGSWGLGFALTFYLALEGGGYDVVVRNEVGVAVWWILLLGCALGVLPLARLGRPAWAALGLLAAFAAWTALGASWSESAERTLLETSRLATYLGVLALGVAACRSGRGRHLILGVASAIAAVGVLAVLSRVHPAWFPGNEVAHFLPGTQSRLNYPLNYWNALAALMAVGAPLVLAIAAADAQSTLTRALAAAAAPVLAACTYLTLSRGGSAAFAIGVIALLALSRRRAMTAAVTLLAAAGSAILIAAIDQRDALAQGLTTATAQDQGDELLTILVVVCAGVGLLAGALALAERHGLGGSFAARAAMWSRALSTKVKLAATAATIAVAVVVFLAAGGPGRVDSAWQQFKNPSAGLRGGHNYTSQRLVTVSGNGRYQFWASAVRAFESEPLHGIGSGTFEFWWARDGSIASFLRNAHSLYLETLAETGVIGLALLVAMFALVLGAGIVAARRAGPLMAGAAAGCIAFMVAAASDWDWQIPAVPVCFLLLAAAVLTARRGRRVKLRPAAAPAPTSRLQPLPPTGWPVRALGLGAALASLVAIALPLAGVVSVRDSQAAAQRSNLSAALDHARSAIDTQPYAGTPRLQKALVLERDGDLTAAAAAARHAEANESTNWRDPLMLSRIEAERGDAAAALAAYRRARALNPKSPIFTP